MPVGPRHKSARGRNVALAWALGAFVVLVFVATVFRLKGNM